MRRPFRLRVIFIQALIATMGSLYLGWYGDPIYNFYTGQWFSPENAFGICDLCRYARILMYPLVLLSGVALLRNDRKGYWTMLPSVILGIALTGFHYTLQMFPIETTFKCTADNPCMAFYVNYFGFLTIPGLALLAFLIILSALIYGACRDRKNSTISTLPN